MSRTAGLTPAVARGFAGITRGTEIIEVMSISYPDSLPDNDAV